MKNSLKILGVVLCILLKVSLTGCEDGGDSKLPSILSVNPSIATQGQTLNVTITGTNFMDATAVSFGDGITVNSFTVNSSTQIEASITIALPAATGLNNVSVITRVGTGTGNGLFKVQAADNSSVPDVMYSFFDEPADIPSGVIGEVDNSTRQFRVVGIASPNTSRYVHFSSNPVPLSHISTIVYDTDVTLATGLRTGILSSEDPCGDGAATGGMSSNSMGTPVLLRVEFTPITFVEISMQSHFGLALEQVINNEQPSGGLSANGGIARTYAAIARWSRDPVDFDPLGLIDEGSVGAQFHARISIDLEQNKVMAEIIPSAGFLENMDPLPVGSYGAIASPFVAVANLIDYTKDPSFDGNLHFKVFVRTNGNTDVDDASAPGGTLRYIDRRFSNVQVVFDSPIEFPPVPQVSLPSDDFNDGTMAAFWDLLPATGFLFKEEDGVLKLSGNQIEDGVSGSSLLTIAYPRQDVTSMIDFRASTGIQTDTFCIFRIQFDPWNYFEIQVTREGYQLLRVIENQLDSAGSKLPLFGDEASKFHNLRLSYKDSTGHVEAYIDDIQLDGIADKVFPTSFADFQFACFAFSVEGQYMEREWDNFISIGAD